MTGFDRGADPLPPRLAYWNDQPMTERSEVGGWLSGADPLADRRHGRSSRSEVRP
jgi:hypothetical protein